MVRMCDCASCVHILCHLASSRTEPGLRSLSFFAIAATASSATFFNSLTWACLVWAYAEQRFSASVVTLSGDASVFSFLLLTLLGGVSVECMLSCTTEQKKNKNKCGLQIHSQSHWWSPGCSDAQWQEDTGRALPAGANSSQGMDDIDGAAGNKAR